MKCPNCNKDGPHLVPPSLGEAAFYICDPAPPAAEPDAVKLPIADAKWMISLLESASQLRNPLSNRERMCFAGAADVLRALLPAPADVKGPRHAD